MPSSLIVPVASSLARRPLVEVFAAVPDPRAARGVRHSVAVILTLAQLAVLAGARTLVAIGEWAHDADRDTLVSAGIPAGARLPSESATRRTLALVDPAGLDLLVAAWAWVRTGVIGGRRVIAIDGKTMRGARDHGDDTARAPHLVAALDHATGTVVGQLATEAKSNEIPALRDLLSTMDIHGAVITADAMHCQHGTAQRILDKGGHYLLTVKANQPTLRKRLEALAWAEAAEKNVLETSRGRRVWRRYGVLPAPDGLGFPGAVQVVRLRRTRTVRSRKTTEVVYLICSLPATDATAEQIIAWIRGHWGIENRLHWVRDVTFDEDRHQLRTGHGPHVMAILRNTAITIHRLAGATNIAAALRHHARDTRRPIQLLITA